MKYRKKPVVIEAMRVPTETSPADRDFAAWWKLTGWLSAGGDWMIVYGLGVAIKTREGTMTASPGDYIIRGVEGELYPCKPDIFAATYELAETN